MLPTALPQDCPSSEPSLAQASEAAGPGGRGRVRGKVLGVSGAQKVPQLACSEGPCREEYWAATASQPEAIKILLHTQSSFGTTGLE